MRRFFKECWFYNYSGLLSLTQKRFSVDNFFLQHYHFRMNAFKDIKQSKKVFLLFFLIVCLSCIIAPIIKVALDSFVTTSPFIVNLLDYHQGGYDFGKVMRRIMMAVAIIVIFLMRKSLMVGSLATLGLKHTQGRWEQLRLGFFLGTGMLTLYVAFLYAIGTRILRIDAESFSDFILQLIKFLFIAGIVGCIEELFFRGFIFQSLLKDMSALPAVCITSIFYSLLHFLKVDLVVSPGIQPFVGFLVMYQFFRNIIVDFHTLLPSIVGLFLVGVVLSYSCLRTRSLYFAIGLHAGWVFLIKISSLLFDRLKKDQEWLFGDGNVVTGILAWILLIVTLIIIWFITNTSSKKALPKPDIT
ncbi:MAG: CPBP family intramembrane metalloprotease [wastewater metagenome]|nr:CPBP family intramembrane metalloprotease [Candidatus Loosdrechtia aerotolerans]